MRDRLNIIRVLHVKKMYLVGLKLGYVSTRENNRIRRDY